MQTTYHNIARYTACIFCAKVRYVDFKNTWIMEGNSLFPFMHKDRKPFIWENEFRIILQKFPEKDVCFDQQDYYECEQENPFYGQVLQVDLSDFIEKTVIAPAATAGLKTQVRRLATEHGLQDKVVESNLGVSLSRS
ncbi:MAG: hypothetical protein ACLP2Y_17375 [Limisphaerales bacterium]